MASYRVEVAEEALREIRRLPGNVRQWPIRAQLDEDEFAGAWAAGQAMPLDQAIALALQEVTEG